MILYHAISSYHLLNAMVHSKTHNEGSTIVLSKWLTEKFPQFKKLEAFFDKVLVMDANYAFLHTAKRTNQYLTSVLGNLQNYSEIYMWGGHFTLGYHLALTKHPFIFCEDAAGLVSRPEILRSIEAGDPLKHAFYEEINEMGLYDGSADSAVKVLCNLSAQEADFIPDERVIDFNVVKELAKLPAEDRAAIQNFFVGEKTIHVEDNALVILTQHLTNLKITTFEQQALAYQLLVDYFFSGRMLVFKPHPDDLMYYSQLFPEAQIIREKFPSEFMPFILDHTPAGIATISSTSICNLRGYFSETFELDNRFDKGFVMTHRYYAAVKLAQKLGLNIVCHDANESLVRQLCKTLTDNIPEVSQQAGMPHLLLVDDVTSQGETGRLEIQSKLQNMPQDSCAVFINSQNDYCWYDYDHRDQWESILPVVLKKQKLEQASEDFYASTEDDEIYVYSPNKELLRMAKETEIQKELPHVGISVEKAVFTPEQEKIKILEGILAATERRLMYYIEKERKE